MRSVFPDYRSVSYDYAPSNKAFILFDVMSLHTNVPFKETIFKRLPKDCTLVILLWLWLHLQMLSCQHRAKYRQVDGRVMGSPPAPPLCSMWLSKFKLTIKGNTKLLNDIWMTHRTTTESLIGNKLSKIKSLLPTLNSH